MGTMFASLAVAAVLVGQAEPGGGKPTTATVHPCEIKAEYDRARDCAKLVVDLGTVLEDEAKGLWVDLVVFHPSRGLHRGPVAD